METFATLGFLFGMFGILFSFTSLQQIAELKKELEALKSQVKGMK
ncbi:MAG: hypothetical protein AAEF23_01340 [Gammaproteobacteria bacterium]